MTMSENFGDQTKHGHICNYSEPLTQTPVTGTFGWRCRRTAGTSERRAGGKTTLVVVATGQSRSAFTGHVNARPSSACSARLKFPFHSSSRVSLLFSPFLSLSHVLMSDISPRRAKGIPEYRGGAQLCCCYGTRAKDAPYYTRQKHESARRPGA